MIPLRDNIPSRTVPFVNYTMIGICSVVFLLQFSAGDASTLVERFGMIPARVLHPGEPVNIVEQRLFQTSQGIEVREVVREAAPAAVAPWLTLLTCIFLHGGWLHVVGNMWFLFIFGDNVEDRLGHVGYLLFYLVSGVAASVAHLVSEPGSTIPTIGASGAIAGVMGAYLVLYPHAKVLSVVPIFIFLHMMVLPAPLFLGFWFVLQFFQGVFSISSVEEQGVAWWAHIGGFVIGAAAGLLVRTTNIGRPPVTAVRPNTERTAYYRVYPPHR